NGNIDIICLAVAAWIRYVSGVDEKGNAIEVSDPLAATLRKLCDDNAGNPRAMVEAIVSLPQVFGSDLIHQPRFIDTTSQWLVHFYGQGVLATIRESFGS